MFPNEYKYLYNYVTLNRENYLEGDPTCLYNAAQALRTIQQLYGIIPRVYGKGQAAKQVSCQLLKLIKIVLFFML